MGSAVSKAKRSALKKVATNTVAAPVGPRIPQEIVDEILDHVADSGSRSLRLCSLVSKSWVHSCRRYLFHTILFTSGDTKKWVKAFPVPQESPARHVRDLRLLSWGVFEAPEEFFEHIPWFINVEKLTLLGYGGWKSMCRILLLGRLPQSVTSLAISADSINALQIRNILLQLPNLNNLSLSGSLSTMDKDALRGIGTALRGSFGGQLRLVKRHAVTDTVNMLLDVPTGLHFTEVDVLATYECLLPTKKLSEACGTSLVKLSYSVDCFYGHEDLDRSFDLSKFLNLREVNFGLRWLRGAPRWIPVALSTIKPATSPCLSAIKLNFVGPPDSTLVIENSIEALGSELQRTTKEVARIRREFNDGIYFLALRDQWFKGILNSLNLTL